MKLRMTHSEAYWTIRSLHQELLYVSPTEENDYRETGGLNYDHTQVSDQRPSEFKINIRAI